MSKKNYGMLMVSVSIIVVIVYTIWVPASYLFGSGEETILFSGILPDPIWGLIIPVYLLILFTAFTFGWIGCTMVFSPPQEEISIHELEKK